MFDMMTLYCNDMIYISIHDCMCEWGYECMCIVGQAGSSVTQLKLILSVNSIF